MNSGFKFNKGNFHSDTYFPEMSKAGQKSHNDTFTSTWGQVKVIDFKKMAKRDLIPESVEKEKSPTGGFSTESQKLTTARSTGWLATTRSFPKEEKNSVLKTAIDFAKQTNRSNWLQPFKGHSSGLDYNTSSKTLSIQAGRLVPFEKTLAREQFADLDTSGNKTSKKKKYFHLGKLKSELPISSLLDFRNMTGRDKEVCLREGYTPLEVA